MHKNEFPILKMTGELDFEGSYILLPIPPTPHCKRKRFGTKSLLCDGQHSKFIINRAANMAGNSKPNVVPKGVKGWSYNSIPL
jgi:hypothetical protein